MLKFSVTWWMEVRTSLFLFLVVVKYPAVFLRLWMVSFRNKEASVCWDKWSSEPFNIRNGVCQGGILSPILFNFYVREVFDDLKKLDCGCYIEGKFVSAIGSVDDLIFLAPKRSALQTVQDGRRL